MSKELEALKRIVGCSTIESHRPKWLCEFWNCDPYPYTKYIGKAPQSWCYVEGDEIL